MLRHMAASHRTLRQRLRINFCIAQQASLAKAAASATQRICARTEAQPHDDNSQSESEQWKVSPNSHRIFNPSYVFRGQNLYSEF